MNKKSNLWLEWTISCGVGELAGLAVAAGLVMAGRVLMGDVDFHGLVLLMLLFLLGGLEGLIVGHFQWSVLKEKYPKMTRRAWMRITAIAMAAAWFWGILPSQAFAGFVTEHGFFTLLTFMAVLAGIVMGGLIGLIQFFELRKHSQKAVWWIPANAFAFMASALVIYWATAWAFSGLPDREVFTLGVFSGLAAGLAVGAVTGLFLGLMPACPEKLECR